MQVEAFIWVDLLMFSLFFLFFFFQGDSPLSSTVFMVAADQEVVIDSLNSFTDALVGMFMCFYIFNMHYPMELGATMEFLQR